MFKVLDSWALMAFFRDQAEAEEVEKLLLKATSGQQPLLLSVIQWGEIYYSIMRAESQEYAEKIAQEITSLPIELIPVGEDLKITRQAAIFKATRRLSYADCFAAALAKIRNADLVTGDIEFKQLEKDIKITWLK